MITLKELVRDTIACHGLEWTAQHYAKRIPFSLFYWLAFGCAPRPQAAPPMNMRAVKPVLFQDNALIEARLGTSWQLGWRNLSCPW